jgi:hypothetical protein
VNLIDNSRFFEFTGFELDKGDKRSIIGLQGADGEVLRLSSPVSTKRKGVEYWLSKIESEMIRTMKQTILETLTQYTVQSAFNPIEFYRGYAANINGQALVLVSNIYYTADLKEILRAGQLQPLKYFARKCSVVIGKTTS